MCNIMRKLADLGLLSKGISHDVLIALCAQSVGATVLTSNKKDFQNIARYLKYSYDIV